MYTQADLQVLFTPNCNKKSSNSGVPQVTMGICCIPNSFKKNHRIYSNKRRGAYLNIGPYK